ncbi:unnamed protein product [Amoebophrya sp. A120]|nr:unnamed protein product [Amoebophrya sp. A120]|eukprot:GSA120T00007432001.1
MQQRYSATPGVMMPQIGAAVPRQHQKQQRALVGFQNVSKFVPPSYEGVQPDQLPCPDTPSPRSNGSPEEEDAEQLHDNQNNYTKASEKLMDQKPPQHAYSGGSRAHGSRQGREPEQDHYNQHPKIINGQEVFPPGTFVEYRSRTMQNRWILAKVESFDDKNRVYRLDVQPKAPMDRVRLRENKDETGVVQQRHSDHAAGGIVPQHGGDQQAGNVQPEVSPLHEPLDPVGDDNRAMSHDQLLQKCRDLELTNAKIMEENRELKSQLDKEKSRSRALEAQLSGR